MHCHMNPSEMRGPHPSFARNRIEGDGGFPVSRGGVACRAARGGVAAAMQGGVDAALVEALELPQCGGCAGAAAGPELVLDSGGGPSSLSDAQARASRFRRGTESGRRLLERGRCGSSSPEELAPSAPLPASASGSWRPGPRPRELQVPWRAHQASVPGPGLLGRAGAWGLEGELGSHADGLRSPWPSTRADAPGTRPHRAGDAQGCQLSASRGPASRVPAVLPPSAGKRPGPR
mmetsp:Transcript_95394/g.269551  ORF Transcript_95394/g.269551 Transcript_95394/m.269551 type:complete len:234 (-) Transcript_95394:1518-2219(-)